MTPRNVELRRGLTVTAEPAPPAGWDSFVAEASGATYCHLAAWRGAMHDVLGHECLYVTVRDEREEVVGALPLVAVRSLLFGNYLVSVPFLNYGGPVGTREARDALVTFAGEEAARRRVDLLELRSRSAAFSDQGQDTPGSDETLPDVELPSGFQVSGRKITVVLPLPPDPTTLFEDGLKAKVRSQVRRPMKEGFETRFGPDQAEAFYEVFARNMRDLGTPVLPAALFHALPALFGEDVTFAVVYDGDRPIAGGCGFHFRGEFELTWASSLREYNRAAPNMLLYWRLMEHAIERGDRLFNFGRCSPGGGTHRFKSQWGGIDEPLPWIAWSPSGEIATPNPGQGKYRIATSIWSRLPLPVTRLAGPPLARRIP